MSEGYMQGNADNAVAVPFSDDTTDNPANDIDEEDSPNDSPEVRITRLAKKETRTQRLLEEGKQSAERVKTLEAEQAQLRSQLERLQGYVVAQPQRAANDAKDPYEARLDAIYAQQSEAYNGAQAEIKAGTFTPERQQHYERIARQIESAKTAVHTERVVDQRAQSMRGEQAQQVWVQKYPEVYNNPKAFQYAQATYQRKLALGEPASNDTVDEIMHETMATFKLGKKAAPSATERARMSGISSASTSSPSRAGIDMTPALKRMAHAAHPDMSEADAEKKWVNSTGKRLRANKVL
jgi:hypothetical protein